MNRCCLVVVAAGIVSACSARTGSSESPDATRATDSTPGPLGDGPGSGSGFSFAPSVGVDELDQNNTSACGSSDAPCAAAWDQTHTITYSDKKSPLYNTTATVHGTWDTAVSTTAHAPGSAFGHVSKVPVSELLAGYKVPVILASMNWWGKSGHISNGESALSAAQATNQVADQSSRGFAGEAVAWDGPKTDQDTAITNLLAASDAAGSTFKIAVRFESETLTCGQTVACLNTQLAFIKSQYATSKAYMTDRDGHPIVFFFLSSSGDYDLLTASGVEPGGMVFVMLEPNGLPPTGSVVGEFDWVAPSDGHSGFSNPTNYFAKAAATKTAYAVGAVFKGFDDHLATWSLDRVIDQQCGMTWLQSFDHTGSFAGSADYVSSVNYLKSGGRLDDIMVDTWDDYEEGTEIETGIDNCMSGFSASLTGNLLTWTPTFSANGSEATVYEYAVYLAEPTGTSVMPIAQLTCTSAGCPHSLDVSTLGITGGPYTFYVQAIGQPSIVNHVAGPTTATYTN